MAEAAKKIEIKPDDKAGEKRKLEARELLIRARLYRLFAYIFGATGVGLFAYFYHTHKSDSVVETLANPVIIIFMVVPFLPALMLALKARKYETKLLETIDTLDQ